MAGGRVKVRERLVEDEQARPQHQCAGDRQLLALATRELVGCPRDQVPDAARRGDVVDPAADLIPRHAHVLRAEGQLALDGGGDQLLAWVLQDGADKLGEVAQPHLGGRATIDRHPSSQIAAIGMWDQAVDGPDQGRLAAAGGSSQEQHLAGLQAEGEIADRRFGAAPIAKGEGFDLEQWAGRHRLRRARVAPVCRDPARTPPPPIPG